jgi:T5SS/PEP-CTERM-associated repeat protein
MIAIGAGRAFAADKYWGSGSDGQPLQKGTWLVFNGTSWVPTSPPGAADRAIFDNAAFGLPSGNSNGLLAGPFGTSELRVRRDFMSLNLNGATYTVGSGGVNIASLSSSNAGLFGSGGTLSTTGPVLVERQGAGDASLLLVNQVLLTTQTINIGGSGGGTMTVDFSSRARADQFFDVGFAGPGTLTLSTGSRAEAGVNFVIGSQIGSNGLVNASGGSTLITAPVVTVGFLGTAQLNLATDADLNVSQTLYIGDGANSTGTMSLTGSGTTAQAQYINVGNRGTGTLNVSGSASASSTSVVDVGANAGSTGALNVTNTAGPGALLQTPVLNVGGAGNGSARIDPSVSLSIGSTLTLGVDPTGVGSVQFKAPATTIPNLNVGYKGIGTLTILSAGSITATNQACIGCELGSTGSLFINGSGSRLLGRFINIPYFGSGDATVIGGGVIGTAPLPNPGLNVAIASQPGSVGILGVSGAGSSLVALDQANAGFGVLFIGDFGDGTFTLSNGATANVRSAELAFSRNNNFRSKGTANITGTGTRLSVTNDLTIGRRGDAIMRVESGGRVDASTIAIGFVSGVNPPANDARANGTLNITGANSRVNAAVSTQVGVDATGSLSITAGGTLSNTFGTVGYSGTGDAVISGANSLWSNTTNINVGRNSGSVGTMTISNGGSVRSGEAFWVGEGAGSNGSVTVSGGLLRARDLLVGDGGTGVLLLQDGIVDLDAGFDGSRTSHIGRLTGSNGQVTVDGSSAFFNNLGSLAVGTSGFGVLTVTNGAGATSDSGVQIGVGFFGDGRLDVGGAGSTFVTNDVTEVGGAGRARLNVTSGGRFRTSNLHIGTSSVNSDPAGPRVVIDSSAGAPGGGGPATLDVEAGIVVGGTGVAEGGRATLMLNTLAPVAPSAGVLVRNAGTLEIGTAIINNQLKNSGTIKAAGPAPMTLTVNGPFTQSPESLVGLPSRGETALRLLGPASYDRITVNGTATLGGALVVNRDENFNPAPGSFIADLISASSIVRPFDVVYFYPEFSDLRYHTLEYISTANRAGQVVRVGVGSLLAEPEFPPLDPGTQTAQVSGRPTQAAAADLNGDGFLDVVAAIPRNPAVPGDTGAVAVIFNLGVNPDRTWRGFAQPVNLFAGIDPVGVAVGDLFLGNGPDLAVVNKGGGTPSTPGGLRLFRNNGAGVFTAFGSPQPIVFDVGTDPRSVGVANFISDPLNLPDIAVSSLDEFGLGQVVLRPNALTGPNPTLLPSKAHSTSGPPGVIEPGGLDNPKQINDLVVCIPGEPGGPQRGLDVFLNNGASNPTDPFDPAFQFPITLTVGLEPVSVAIADIDRDGDNDLVTADLAGATVSIALNQLNLGDSNSPFRVSSLPVPAFPRSVAILDLDQDTDLDIALVTLNDAADGNVIRVLRNDTPVGSEALVFALAESIGAGTDPQYILPGNIDADPDSDIIAFSDQPSGPGDLATAYVNAYCFGDPNRDRIIDLADLSILLANFGTTTPAPNTLGDSNGNAIVDTRDLVIMISRFGTACP